MSDDTNWNPLEFDTNGLIVTYQEKYGNEITIECIGLWENNSQYMLTWKDSKRIILQKENIDSIKVQDK